MDQSRPFDPDAAAKAMEGAGGRQQMRANAPRESPIPAIRNDSDFAKIRPGQKYRGPDGNTYTKLYTVEHDEDFAALPEGARYLAADGNTYTKPSFAPVSGTAQFLYDAAPDDDTKERALRAVYGDKVKNDESGLYVEDEDGTLRKPGARDLATTIGSAASGVGPIGGMIGGAALGEGAGPAGAFAGMVGGAAAGRQFNNIILSLYGVNQSTPKQLSEMAWEGAGAAIGEPIGKAIGTLGKGAKSLVDSARGFREKIRPKAPEPVSDDDFQPKYGTKKSASRFLEDLSPTRESLVETLGGGLGKRLPGILEEMGVTPESFREYSGATEARAERTRSLAEKGYHVPPKASMPGFPMLHKMQDFYDLFHVGARDEANEAVANKEMRRIMEHDEIGLKLDELPTQATKAVSSKEAGQLALDAAHRELAQANAEIENTTRDLKLLASRPILEAGGEEAVRAMHQEAISILQAQQERAMASAETLIRGGVGLLRQEADTALMLAGHGEDPSAVNRMVDAGFRTHDRAMRQQARTFYDNARAAYGDAPPPDVSGLADHAEAFLRRMPEAVRSKYPSEIGELARLVDRDVEIPGVSRPQPLAEGQQERLIGWADLHHLRSWLRHGIDYNDLTPDMRAGALKHFERQVDKILRDPNGPPEVRQAAALLDQADAFYRENIPFLGDQMVKKTVKALESGVGVNPGIVAHWLFDPDRTAALQRARSILGESAWRTVEAAHTAHLVDNSRTVTGQVDFARFYSQVEDLVRNNVIDTGYSPQTARRLRELANQMGRFKGSIPIDVDATDTLSMIMRRGAAAKAEGERLAQVDPLNMFSEEVKRLDKEAEAAQKASRAGFEKGPLGFLYQDSMSEKAVTAGDKIIDNEDLTRAFVTKHDRDSPEFKAMQRVFVQRFFQRPYSKLGAIRPELADPAKGITEEMQALWFPGVTREMMLQFAKDMEFLQARGDSDFGGSLAGAQRILHPEQSIPYPISRGAVRFFGHFPGVSFVHRLALGHFYKIVMEAAADPSFASWVAGNLKGGAMERIAARQAVQQRLRMSGLGGAAAGQMVFGGPSSHEPEQTEMAQ